MFKCMFALALVNCSLSADNPIWEEPKHRIIGRVYSIESALARIKYHLEVGDLDEIKQDLDFIQNHLLGRDINYIPGY